MDISPMAVLAFGFVVMLTGLFSLFISMFKTCPPNAALVVYGALSREPRIIIGGGTVVIPLVESCRSLSLELMTLDVKTEAPFISRPGIPIFIESVAQVKISADNESIKLASQILLAKGFQEIVGIANDIILHHMRDAVGRLSIEEIIQNSESFARGVGESSLADFHKLGLTLVSICVRELRDSVGYLEQLGSAQAAETKKKADIGIAEAVRETEIAKAEAMRIAQIAQAEAEREAKIEVAKITRDTQLATLPVSPHAIERDSLIGSVAAVSKTISPEHAGEVIVYCCIPARAKYPSQSIEQTSLVTISEFSDGVFLVEPIAK